MTLKYKNDSMERRIDIQLLRALAVIFVVLFHLETPGIASGFLGVDVFFVVSGFLMAILYKQGETKKFFERRAKRLLPAYFTTVLVTLLLAIFLILPSELGQVVNQSIYSLFFVNNIGFWMQNSYFSKLDFNPLLHLWSLGVEIQFYLIVPVLAWLFSKTRIFLFLAILASFLACIFILGISTKTSFFMMPLRMWEFLIGFVVAYYFTIHGAVKYQRYSWIGLVSLAVLCLIPFLQVDGETLNRFSGHPSFYALLVCIMTGLVLSFGLPKFIQHHALSQMIAKIGDYSYSIYLVHFPIIVLYLYTPFAGTTLHAATVLDKVILFCLIVVASILMHRGVETRKLSHIGKVYLISIASIFMLTGAAKISPSLKYNTMEVNIFHGLEDRDVYRCGKLMRIFNPRAISCKINAENFEQSVLLVGNSHADSIKKVFAEVATQHQLNTYFLVSNTPLMDQSVTPQRLIEEAEKLKIKHIVLHYSPNALQQQMLEQTIALAQHAKIKVDFIMPVPIYAESVPKMIYLDHQQFKYDVMKYHLDVANFSQQTAALQDKYKNLTVQKVSQIFCHPQCEIADHEKRPYYFDSNHLNLTGSRLLKPIFDQIL